MKQTITVPTDLKDITLEQYQKFLRVVEGNEDETFIRQKMVQIFCNVPLKDIDQISLGDFNEITNTIAQTLEQEPKLVQKFELNGVQYGFIPDLGKMSLGEYIDLDNSLGDWSKMVASMSVLYRPIIKEKGSKYKIKRYRAEENPDLAGMPLDAVISSMLFFWILSNDLLNYTLKSSLKAAKTKEIQERLTTISQQNGVGTPPLSHSLTEILPELRKSLGKNFIQPSFTFVS
ncbi:hypothetical protein [Flagellimonas onchidii]|uniref:hypothetical protein n=1 Tax=Flagellimonas onchidii TaxID=2562684 RepID=UPI0010A62642|nr:hypothetical protein [Allomuricauda onchidii]